MSERPEPPAVAAVILAAGRATRFGAGPQETKAAARLNGEALVRHVTEAALASRARPVIVVTGHAADQVAASLAGLDVSLVMAVDFAAGLSRSLQAGIAALPADVAGALVLLADMPFVSAPLLDKLIEAFEAAPGSAAIVPIHKGRRGNPVLLACKLFTDVAALEGDRGASQILARRDDVAEYVIDDAAVTLDVDTAEDLLALNARRL